MELMSAQKHPKKSECVAQGGTYSGNPLVMRAGYEATRIYEDRTLYAHIDRLGAKLMKGLEEAVEDTGANARVTGYGSKVKIHFLKRGSKINDMKSLVVNCDTETEKRYFAHLISNRIFALTQVMVHFYISLPHTEQEIDDLISATRSFLKSAAK
jgi:glutamate-1-semialdehyde 2,1-aminomutase